eukprot:6140206-Karenia_brevis.AAC.1
MAYCGEGENEDGETIYPRLTVDGSKMPLCQIHRWGGDFPTPYTQDEFEEEARSYDPKAMCEQMASYRVYTLEQFEALRYNQENKCWTESNRSMIRKLSNTWDTFFLAAAPGRRPGERLMIM